jgi:hypothetical protein
MRRKMDNNSLLDMLMYTSDWVPTEIRPNTKTPKVSASAVLPTEIDKNTKMTNHTTFPHSVATRRRDVSELIFCLRLSKQYNLYLLDDLLFSLVYDRLFPLPSVPEKPLIEHWG